MASRAVFHMRDNRWLKKYACRLKTPRLWRRQRQGTIKIQQTRGAETQENEVLYMESFENRIGEKIAALRRAKGLTQEQLAEQLGVSAPAVSKWETGVSLR